MVFTKENRKNFNNETKFKWNTILRGKEMDEFIIKNKHRLHLIKSTRRGYGRIFKYNGLRLKRNDIYRIIFDCLSDNPQGLTISDLTFLTGISYYIVYHTIKDKDIFYKANNGFGKIYIREIGNYYLYYAAKYTRKLQRRIKEMQSRNIQLVEKLEKWQQNTMNELPNLKSSNLSEDCLQPGFQKEKLQKRLNQILDSVQTPQL